MLRDGELIDQIHAEEEAAVADVAQPTIAEAYEQGTDNVREESSGARKRMREPREAIPSADTLAEAEQNARHWNEVDKQRAAKLPKKEQNLSQAYSGEEPEDADVLLEQDGIPASLQRYSPTQIGAAMEALGLDHSDLEDPRWTAVLLAQLEASDPDSEEGDDSEDDEPETELEEDDQPEEKSEEPKAEEKKEEPAAPIAHRELLPEEVDQYVEKTWAKMEQVSSPQMRELFAENLDEVLSKVPANEDERKAQLRTFVNLAEYGVMSMVQSAHEAMTREFLQANLTQANHEYLSANLLPALEHFLPGLTEAHHRQSATTCWDAVRSENDAFADLPDFESPEFVELRDKIRAANPWIDSWDPDPKMPPMQALKQKAALFARLALGERVDPKRHAAQIADALQVGKRSAERSTRRVTASGMLGKGRSSGSIGEQKERAGLMDAWNAQHGKGSEGI
jgi:hypothetical protein